MQTIISLTLLTSAAAFVGPAGSTKSTALNVATMNKNEFAYGLPGNMIPGVPASRFDFDPLGFSERASPEEMLKYREAELKHGRVAMLAITGMLFAEVWHPMLASINNVPAIYAFQEGIQTSVVLAPVLLGIAAVELVSFPSWIPGEALLKPTAVPGAYANLPGASPWTKDKLSPAEYERKEVVELNNGRLAMLAIAGMVGQELASGAKLTSCRYVRHWCVADATPSAAALATTASAAACTSGPAFPPAAPTPAICSINFEVGEATMPVPRAAGTQRMRTEPHWPVSFIGTVCGKPSLPPQ